MKLKRIALISLSALIGMASTFFLNFFWFEGILIPDPCYYHEHDTNFIFDLFYEITASNGDHPFPTIFNLIFTLTIGALIGIAISTYLTKKRDKKTPNR